MKKKVLLLTKSLWDVPGTMTGDVSPITGASAIRQALLKSKKVDYTVDVFEIFNYNQIKQLLANSYDLLGLSMFAWNFSFFSEVISSLEKDFPELPVTVGGPGAAEYLNRELPKNVIFACLGEGEGATREALDSYFTEGEVINMDGLITKTQKTTTFATFPDFNLDSEDYFYRELLNRKNVRTLTWEISRGCPFGCSFCMWSISKNKKVRSISDERFKKELDLILKSGAEEVFVADATFNAQPELSKEKLRYLAENSPDKPVYCLELRGELIDEEMAQLLSKIKCRVDLGLQSMDKEVLHAVHRPCNFDKFFQGVQYLNKYKIDYWVDLILFLPGETKESFIKGIEDAILNGVEALSINYLNLFPGNLLYTQKDSFVKGTTRSQGGLEIVTETTTINREDYLEIAKFMYGIKKLFNPSTEPFNMDALMYAVGENNLKGLGIIKELSEKTNLRPYELIRKFIK